MKHVCMLISVADINAARKFYEDLFGLEVFQDYGRNIAFTCGLALQQDFDWLVDLPKEKVLKKSNNTEIVFEEQGVYPKFCVNVKNWCKNQSGSRRRAGHPVRRLDFHETGIPQAVKGSGAAAVYPPLTGKEFLLPGHPISVIDRQLGMNDAPILPASGPFLRNVHHGEHF